MVHIWKELSREELRQQITTFVGHLNRCNDRKGSEGYDSNVGKRTTVDAILITMGELGRKEPFPCCHSDLIA